MNELNPNLNKANKEVTMELNFIKSGDYYIPDIKLKNPNIRLGKWGRMRREYLRQAHPIVFSEMVLSETLYEHCAEIEATAKKRMDVILPQLMKYYGVSYLLDKSRLSIRLQPPMSEERRRKASENAKQNGFNSHTE